MEKEMDPVSPKHLFDHYYVDKIKALVADEQLDQAMLLFCNIPVKFDRSLLVDELLQGLITPNQPNANEIIQFIAQHGGSPEKAIQLFVQTDQVEQALMIFNELPDNVDRGPFVDILLTGLICEINRNAEEILCFLEHFQQGYDEAIRLFIKAHYLDQAFIIFHNLPANYDKTEILNILLEGLIVKDNQNAVEIIQFLYQYQGDFERAIQLFLKTDQPDQALLIFHYLPKHYDKSSIASLILPHLILEDHWSADEITHFLDLSHGDYIEAIQEFILSNQVEQAMYLFQHLPNTYDRESALDALLPGLIQKDSKNAEEIVGFLDQFACAYDKAIQLYLKNHQIDQALTMLNHLPKNANLSKIHEVFESYGINMQVH